MSAYFVIRLNKLLTPGLVILVLGGLVGLLLSDLFKVKSIVCKTQYAECPSQTQEKLLQFLGQHILLVDEGKIEDQVLSDFRVRRVFIRRLVPAKLEVLVEERKAQAAILAGEELFLVDREGMVLEKIQATNLPKLEVSGKTLDKGSRIDGEMAIALVLLDLLARAGYKIDGRIANGLFLSRIEGAEVILPLDRDPRVLFGSLQLIMTAAKIEGRKIVFLDLRFKNPILKFAD